MDALFDNIIQIIPAYIQIVMLGVGSLLILLAFLSWRDFYDANKITRWLPATIVVLRKGKGLPDENGAQGDVYYPVYEVIGEAGNVQNYESEQCSSDPQKYRIGSRCHIRLLAKSPGFAEAKGDVKNHLIIGLFLGIIGGVLLSVALCVIPFGPLTVPVWGAAIVLFVLKFGKSIKPKNLWETVEQFRSRKSRERLHTQQAIPEISSHAISKEIEGLEPARKLVQRISVLVGFGLLLLGGLGYNAQQDFMGQAVHVKESPCSTDIQMPDCRKTVPLTDILSLLPSHLRPKLEGIYRKENASDQVIGDFGFYTSLPFWGIMGLGALILLGAITPRTKRA